MWEMSLEKITKKRVLNLLLLINLNNQMMGKKDYRKSNRSKKVLRRAKIKSFLPLTRLNHPSTLI